MKKTATQEIDEMVGKAEASYEFFWRGDEVKGDLLRIRNRRVDQLLDGDWIVTGYLGNDDGVPKDLAKAERGELFGRARRFLLADLDAEPSTPTAKEWATRMRRSRLGRWLIPPLQGGAARHGHSGATVTRCKSSYVDELRHVTGGDLGELKAQILDGYESDLARTARVEQRANVFLGASVLTSSLVLGNAGLLLGSSEKLGTPYLQIAAGALAVASMCAIVGAFRALQTMLFTFHRINPVAAKNVFNRRRLTGDDLIRDYVGTLFIAANRAATVADWKVNQMKAARRWILATSFGVVVLTIVVLIDAVWVGG
jgi:hypothetical protein